MKVRLIGDIHREDLEKWLRSSVGDALELELIDETSAAESPSDVLYLVHYSQFDSGEQKLEEWARPGAVVVEYSGGGLAESMRACGSGWVCRRPLSMVEDVIARLHHDSSPVDVKNAFEALEQRHLLVALDVLVQCASAPVEGSARRDRQKAWRTEPHKWASVFQGAKIEDFQYALTGKRGTWPGDGYVHVAELVEWFLEGRSTEKLDFDKARGELEKRL